MRGGLESDFVGVLVGCTELPHGLVGGACGVDPEVGYRAGYGRLGFGAVPQRGPGTAGFRFRTFAVDATLPGALLRMDVGMPSRSFPAFAGLAEVDPGVDRGVHHFATLGLLQVATPTGTGRDLPGRRKGGGQ